MLLSPASAGSAATWQLPLGILLGAAAVLLTIWWRQQTVQWPVILALCLLVAPALSIWSGSAFRVAEYRAGCDGLCPGSCGAPVATHLCTAGECTFSALGFILNTLVYLATLLGWSALVRALVRRAPGAGQQAAIGRAIVGIVLWIAPFALIPLYVAPPQAHVRGDPQRIAINAQREVYMYDQLAAWPVLRVGLSDVRPRPDGEKGMRVCFQTYTYFYIPTGLLYLDMTLEGVHSTQGGVLPRSASCWS